MIPIRIQQSVQSNRRANRQLLVANHGSGAALALQAVTHRDARWFVLNRKAKLSAVAGGVSGRHGPAPWLSILAECRLDFKLEGSLICHQHLAIGAEMSPLAFRDQSR
jgi:hypothetical protein